jgi:hypothetical protein
MACETNLSPVQGDQIGRSFASWARVYFRIVFCKITEVALIFGTTVFRGNGYVLIMTQKWDGLDTYLGTCFHKIIRSP